MLEDPLFLAIAFGLVSEPDQRQQEIDEAAIVVGIELRDRSKVELVRDTTRQISGLEQLNLANNTFAVEQSSLFFLPSRCTGQIVRALDDEARFALVFGRYELEPQKDDNGDEECEWNKPAQGSAIVRNRPPRSSAISSSECVCRSAFIF